MSAPTSSGTATGAEAPLCGVQPGGGFCMRCELAWGRLRRWWLRRFHSDYVARLTAKRRGQCDSCPGQARGCRRDVIDARDLKYFRNVCGYFFDPADDHFRWRDDLVFARHGWGEIVIFTLLALALGGLLAVLGATILPGWLTALAGAALGGLWVFLLAFFRDPKRAIPADPAAVLCPADGVVTDVGPVDDASFPGGRALRISIFLSVFNVHVNRCPRAGRITGLRYFPGKYLNALRPVSAQENEQLWIDLEDAATGQPLRVKQIAGAIARRIVCPLRIGDVVRAGERFGMIKFGSRTDLLVPASVPVEVLVSVGAKVKGGSTVLLRLI